MKRRQFIERVVSTAVLSARPGLASPVAVDGSGGRPAAGEQVREFFYRPEGAWAADFIPFCKNGRFHLFYLLDWRDVPGHGEGTPWYQISTEDFVHFTEHGEMLKRGTVEDQDLYVFTGSLVEGAGRYHIFYTGHNPHFRKQGKPEQGIMHAVSDDLIKWSKIPEDTFYAPQGLYEPHDWRDPFVFWNSEVHEYWMLVAARLKTGPSRRRGCTALCTSKDLRKWEVREPFWAPGLYYTHEVPDLFKMGDWWYLVFCEFTERMETRYRMSKSLEGPWLAPDNDSFDGRGLYAGKTASDGHRRFLFGWDATRSGQRDYRPWDWGGNLVVHQLIQEMDGALSVKVPESVDRAFPRQVPAKFEPGLRNSEINGNIVRITAPGSFGCSAAGTMPSRCKIEATVEFEEGTRGCGIMLRASQDYESAYYIRLEPARNRLVFDCWPRAGYIPYWVELERPLQLKAHVPVQLKVFIDGTVCVVYAADKIAMSTRLYNLASGNWGVFVNEGSARFKNIRISIAG